MVQNAFQKNGRRKLRHGENTPEGRRSQIKHKLGHGIRALSPVLLGVERQEDWQAHYEGICRSLNPGNEFEADLVYLIAWQLWRFGRLIRHETALTTEKIHEPPESMFDLSRSSVTKEAILDAIAKLEGKKRNGNSGNGASSKEPKTESNNSLLSRCRAIENGAADVMFDPLEVREILGRVLEQVHWSREEQNDLESDDGEADNDDDSQGEEFTIEERPWSAGEIAEQIQILSDAAGVDWREELSWAIQSLEEAEDERARQIDEARRHVLRNLVLDERDVTRLGLYERQINAQFKSTYSLLERARAWRLGMPIPPAVSVDLTVSKGHDATVFSQRLLAGLRGLRGDKEVPGDDTFQDPDDVIDPDDRGPRLSVTLEQPVGEIYALPAA
jgi:hypothetical protein